MIATGTRTQITKADPGQVPRIAPSVHRSSQIPMCDLRTLATKMERALAIYLANQDANIWVPGLRSRRNVGGLL